MSIPRSFRYDRWVAHVRLKTDLAAAVEFDRRAAMENIHDVRPGLPILEVSAKTGQGMAEWIEFLIERRQFAAIPSDLPQPADTANVV